MLWLRLCSTLCLEMCITKKKHFPCNLFCTIWISQCCSFSTFLQKIKQITYSLHFHLTDHVQIFAGSCTRTWGSSMPSMPRCFRWPRPSGLRCPASGTGGQSGEQRYSQVHILVVSNKREQKQYENLNFTRSISPNTHTGTSLFDLLICFCLLPMDNVR